MSVVVCVYNRAKQVGHCLASLIAQDHPGVEVVVVNDGSTDNTGRGIEEFRLAHPTKPIVIVHNERNLGVSGARNAGVAAARGEFVAFIDSDCTAPPEWLATLVSGFNAEDVAAVAGTIRDHPPRNWTEQAYVGTCLIGQQWWQGRGLVGNNMAFRRSVLARYLFEPALRYGCDEDELAWRMQSDGYRIAHVAGACVNHNHPMTLRTYLRVGYKQGQGSARFWYKQGTFVGRDIVPVTLALLTLPLGFISLKFLAVPLFFTLLQIAALVYNQYALKGKRLVTAIKVLPLDIAYYCCKTTSVYLTLGRILLGYEPDIRESKRRWWAGRKTSAAYLR